LCFKRVSTGNGEEKNSVKTDGNKLSLRGTLHYLWEQARFNKWSPGMAGKRNWFVIRKYLYEAAKDKTAKNISNENGHLMVVGTFGINESGIPSFEEIALMMVTENWIPYDNADELRLINTLTQANQCFIKCLRYNLPSTVPTASVLLANKDKMATALFICPTSASERYRNDLNSLIESSEIKTWFWDAGHEVLPKFPFKVSEDLK
jgi:Protein of unknown function (DUF1173)